MTAATIKLPEFSLFEWEIENDHERCVALIHFHFTEPKLAFVDTKVRSEIYDDVVERFRREHGEGIFGRKPPLFTGRNGVSMRNLRAEKGADLSEHLVASYFVEYRGPITTTQVHKEIKRVQNMFYKSIVNSC